MWQSTNNSNLTSKNKVCCFPPKTRITLLPSSHCKNKNTHINLLPWKLLMKCFSSSLIPLKKIIFLQLFSIRYLNIIHCSYTYIKIVIFVILSLDCSSSLYRSLSIPVFIYFKSSYGSLKLVFIKYNFMYQFSIYEPGSFLSYKIMFFCWFFPAQFLSKPTLQMILLSDNWLIILYTFSLTPSVILLLQLRIRNFVLDTVAFSICIFCL